MSKQNVSKHTFSMAESYLVANAFHFHLEDTKDVPKEKQTFPSYDFTKRVFKKIMNGQTDFSHKEVKAQLFCILALDDEPMFSDPQKIQHDPKISASDKFYYARVYRKYHKPLRVLINTVTAVFLDTMSPSQRATAISILDHNHGNFSSKVLYEILHI